MPYLPLAARGLHGAHARGDPVDLAWMRPSCLPIDEAIPELRAALADSRAVVLQAPPGAGKTTGVPPALLEE